jgi:signal transduction histidine kinase/DNA-binding response OmpR family regulator
MSFGRKIANRILVATALPLAVMFLAGCLVAHVYGPSVSIYRYALSQLVVMLTAVVVLGAFTRRFAMRLSRLAHSAERIESGDLEARLPEDQDGDEFSEIGRALNKMADVLAIRGTALREQNEILAALNSRMESVLNATNDGIALLDRDGRIALANRKFGDLLGVRSEALLQRTVSEALAGIDAPTHGALNGSEYEGGGKAEKPAVSALAVRLADLSRNPVDHSVGVAEEIVQLDGLERRFVQVYTAPVVAMVGGDWVGRIVAVHDVTREYELDKMKSEFIDVVSHELRTPLTSIRGYTDLMLSGAGGEMNELQSEFLGIIQGSTNRLANLINDILDMSRIQSGRINLRRDPVNYLATVTEVLGLMKAAADEKQIVLEASLPESLLPVRGDADKVNQVLANLVSNAIKYTPAGGSVKVMVEATDDAYVGTCVADTGIGINVEDQKRLFQKFFRADNSSTREAGGTGLGLVITKTIVEMLGGAIWVESEADAGSRFFFTLPFYVEAADFENVTLPDRGIGLILVVDDNMYVRDMVQHLLHRRGYGTMGAFTAAETLQKARHHRPDAILLNMMLGGANGVNVLRALKHDRATASLPLVMASIVSDPARGILSTGAFSVVQHPFEGNRLVDRIIALVDGDMTWDRGDRPDRADAISVPTSATPPSIDGMGGSAPGMARRAVPKVLLVTSRDAAEDDVACATRKLKEHGIDVWVARDPQEALLAAISESPALIAIDMATPDAALTDLIAVLKVEEEAARIPILLLSDDISDENAHLHSGAPTHSNTGALEYLYEQLAQIMATQSGKLKVES